MAFEDPKTRIGKTEQILCPRCNVYTRHTIHGTHEAFWNDEESDLSGGSTYDLMARNGCDTATLRETSWFSEAPGENAVTLWPPRGENSPHVRPTKEYECFPCSSPIEACYRETIAAFNQGLPILAGAGVRLIIEGICKDQGIIDGAILDPATGAVILARATGLPVRKDNLEGRINGMAEKGLVSVNQATILHEIRLLGNDAAHELYRPDDKILNSALDIIEHVISQLYEQPKHAKTLAARKRPKKT
jgi:hypothetical protein